MRGIAWAGKHPINELTDFVPPPPPRHAAGAVRARLFCSFRLNARIETGIGSA